MYVLRCQLGRLNHLGPVSHMTSMQWLTRRALQAGVPKDAQDKGARCHGGKAQKSSSYFFVASKGEGVHWSTGKDGH